MEWKLQGESTGPAITLWENRIIYKIKQVCGTTVPTCFWILVVSSPTFFWASPTKKWTIIDWKVNVSKPAPIHGEHQSPAQWPHTHIPRENKTGSPTEVLCPNLQPRTKQRPTDLHKANLFTFTQTNKRQATDQPKHWALLSPCQKILPPWRDRFR